MWNLLFILTILCSTISLTQLLYHRLFSFRLVQCFYLFRSENSTDPIVDFVQRFQLCLYLFQLPGKGCVI